MKERKRVMSKLKILLLISLIAAVTACGGGAATTPTAVPLLVTAIPPTPVKAAPPTAVAAAPTQPSGGLAITPASVASPPKLDPAGMCKVASAPQPVPGFPTTTPADHARGSDKASVVFYEYSDFQ
jgi:hypothetical protein